MTNKDDNISLGEIYAACMNLCAEKLVLPEKGGTLAIPLATAFSKAMEFNRPTLERGILGWKLREWLMAKGHCQLGHAVSMEVQFTCLHEPPTNIGEKEFANRIIEELGGALERLDLEMEAE